MVNSVSKSSAKRTLFLDWVTYESNNLKKKKIQPNIFVYLKRQYYHFWLLVEFVQSDRILGLEARGPEFDPRQGGSDFSFYF